MVAETEQMDSKNDTNELGMEDAEDTSDPMLHLKQAEKLLKDDQYQEALEEALWATKLSPGRLRLYTIPYEALSACSSAEHFHLDQCSMLI